MKRHVPEESVDILLASLSRSTRKQYNASLKKWFQFCEEKLLDPWKPIKADVLKFLTERFHKGVSYSSLNLDRSAISLISENEIGKDSMVSRFISGCYKLKPPRPKYTLTWDVDVVLDYLERLGAALSLKDLTLKTIMLLALCTAQRAQSMSLIDLGNIFDYENKLVITISELTKNSRPGFNHPTLEIIKFNERPNLCLYRCMKDYIQKTGPLRGAESLLFITLRKPYKAVGTQTLARWIKTVLKEAGINTNIFSAHSTRHAATSTAFSKGVDVESIRRTAGWSEKSLVFAKHYNKPTDKHNRFASAILGKK